MERHTKIRKWIIYSGVFFLALSTVITIVGSSSKFNAQVAIEPCVAIVDTNGDGLVNADDDCTGSGGGNGGGVEPCPEPIPVEEGTTIATVPDCEPVCEDDPPFDPALTTHTDGAFQAQVSKSKSIEDRIKEAANDAISTYKARFNATLTMLKYPSSWFSNQTNLNRFTTTFSNEMSSILLDPTLPYYRRIDEATRSAPEAMKSAMLTFTYPIPEHKAEAHSPVPGPSNPKFSIDVQPNWSEWVSKGLLTTKFNLGLNHKVQYNNGSETWCDVRLGVVVGGTDTRAFGLDASLGWRNPSGGLQLVGKGLFTPEWRAGVQYTVRF